MNRSQTLVKKRRGEEKKRGCSRKRRKEGDGKMDKESFEFQTGSMIILPLLPVY